MPLIQSAIHVIVNSSEFLKRSINYFLISRSYFVQYNNGAFYVSGHVFSNALTNNNEKCYGKGGLLVTAY